MRHLMLCLLLSLSVPAVVAAQGAEELRELETEKPVEEATDALIERLETAGMTVYDRVNHPAVEGAPGGASELVLFGDPETEAQLLSESRLAGLALPLRVLVYEDADGQVRIVWEDPASSLTRHGGIAPDAEPVLRLRLELDNIVSQASVD